MSELNEYYIFTDSKKLFVSVNRYVFDEKHPRGFRKQLAKINYTTKAGYKYKEAYALCERLCTILNSTNFKPEGEMYAED